MNDTTSRMSRRRFFGTAAVAAAGAAAGGAATGGYFHHKARQKSEEFLSGQIFANPTFDFTARAVLGTAYYGCANPGKVLAIASNIQDGDYESGYKAFFDAGNEARRSAGQVAGQHQQVSAPEAILWAAN